MRWLSNRFIDGNLPYLSPDHQSSDSTPQSDLTDEPRAKLVRNPSIDRVFTIENPKSTDYDETGRSWKWIDAYKSSGSKQTGRSWNLKLTAQFWPWTFSISWPYSFSHLDRLVLLAMNFPISGPTDYELQNFVWPTTVHFWLDSLTREIFLNLIKLKSLWGLK